MTVRYEQPALNLRALLAKVAGLKPAPRYETFDFEFDGVEVKKSLPAGWKPKIVFLNGGAERKGVGNDYTLSESLGVWSITWGTTPNITDWAMIYAECQP